MWIEVDSNKEGVTSWVAGDHVERCDVNAVPEPPTPPSPCAAA